VIALAKSKLLATWNCKNSRVFANSALWPNSGRKCHKASTRTRPVKPGPTYNSN